ncbi:hypothetical protein [Paenibacillus sp. CR_12]|uniref:hypothetical protein n=1 Tax=Paenibacillus sp. CR_12 TaxID=3055793 RepID=UPI0035BF0794
MNHKAMGMIFICISVFLYAVRYLAAAIFGSNLTSWSKEMFDSMLTYVGKGPLVLSWICLIVGILCFLGPSIGKWNSEDLNKIKKNWKEFDPPNNK